ncbi:immunity 8 family protein [Paenibacillus illinoisensis]|uniref:immunity 8 family protein n=1 Tax=Paenibacillus illinoisensis TaxID=59845 RepID=UPI0021AC8251|nr:immunity 8 family protein [Paenibacillus illinoisensis]
MVTEPEDTKNFVVAASADIGSENVEGEDYFYFRIVTPNKLIEILNEDKILKGRATFIINEFDLSLVETEINKILEDCIRPTWDEVSKATNRHLKWEYDNVHYETYEEAMTRIEKQ